MKIRGNNGKIYTVMGEELYIKPFYKGDVVEKWGICLNVDNKEEIVAEYVMHEVAKHMVRLLKRFNLINIDNEMGTCFPEKTLMNEIGVKIKNATFEGRKKDV